MQAENGGYVAVILPRIKPIQELVKNLLTADEYQEALRKRQQEENGNH